MLIQYYQELLNECIDIWEHKKINNILKEMIEFSRRTRKGK